MIIKKYLSEIYGRIILKKEAKKALLKRKCNLVEVDTYPSAYF